MQFLLALHFRLFVFLTASKTRVKVGTSLFVVSEVLRTRMRLVPRVEQVLVVLVYSAHVLLVPGTKVEESFTLHATRDVVVRGTSRLALPHVRRTLSEAGRDPRLTFVPFGSTTTPNSQERCRGR